MDWSGDATQLKEMQKGLELFSRNKEISEKNLWKNDEESHSKFQPWGGKKKIPWFLLKEIKTSLVIK